MRPCEGGLNGVVWTDVNTGAELFPAFRAVDRRNIILR